MRVALVTGSNTGIGRAIAERLLRDGYSVSCATHSDDDETREAIEQLSSIGPAHWVVGDLADPAVPERLVSETLDALGRIEVLVNNAGLSTAKPALELTVEDFDRTFNVDVRAAFLLSQAAARVMDGEGVIVNITSVHEHVPRPGFAVYAAAKAALGMLTRGLAIELAPIRVVAVAPGLVLVERTSGAEKSALVDEEIPLERPGEPEEVAALVSFLCSDQARYITGTSILMDGGMAAQVVSSPAS